MSKRIVSLIIASIMVLGTAIASGTVGHTTGGSGSSTYVNYSFDVDGNYYDPVGYFDSGNSSHYGKTSTRGFAVSSPYGNTANVTFTFSGAYNSGAYVVVYNESTQICEGSFTIPLHQSGMGTLTYSMTLPNGQHYVKIVSSTLITYSTGTVKVSGISGHYKHTIPSNLQ